jgi:hypothetical protein
MFRGLRMNAVASARPPLVVALGVGVTLAVGILAFAGASAPTLDDGFIVLVYARHLAEGGGIYWNTTDGRVDGYTSFLDMILKAASLTVWPSDPLRNAHVLTIGFVVASMVGGAAFAYRSARSSGRSWPILGTVSALAFGANVALAQGAAFLLETPLYAVVTIASLHLLLLSPVERRAVRAALAATWILLALVRPEGAPIAILEAAVFVLLARPRLDARRVAAPCAVAALAVFAYYAWHLAYFGHLAPNTFYAKSGDSRWQEIVEGASYVKRYLAPAPRGAAHLLLASVTLAVLVRRAWSSREDRLRFAAASGIALLGVVEVVVEGGDSYDGGRFLAVPIVALLATAALGAATMRPRWRLIAAVPLALFVIEGLARIATHPRARLERIVSWPMTLRELGCERAAIELVAERVGSFSQTDMQRAKFFADRLYVIDLASLNDMRAAHEAGDSTRWGKGYLSRAVHGEGEVLQLGTRSIQAAPMARFSTQELIEDESLSARFIGYSLNVEAREPLIAMYVPMSLPICGAAFNVFVRKDRAARFGDGTALVGVSRR